MNECHIIKTSKVLGLPEIGNKLENQTFKDKIE
jgi:hypothetical protein